MANINAVKVPTAVEHKTKLDLSHDHVTTMGFMRSQPVFYRHMMRGEKLQVKCDSTVRLAPVEVPFFGSLVQNLRYFAVKYSQIFPNWYNFYNDNIGSNYSNSSLVSGVPILTNAQLMLLFTDIVYDYTNPSCKFPLYTLRQARFDSSRTILIDGESVTFPAGWYTTEKGYFDYDEDPEQVGVVRVDGDPVAGFEYQDNAGYDYQYDTYRFRYEMWGRRFLYILESLGYKVIYIDDKHDITYNALAILALCKIFVDWYSNSQYLNSPEVLLFERLVKYNDPTGQLSIDAESLATILSMVSTVVYDTDDYFTNAYDNPTSAVSGQFSSFSVFDPTSTGGAYVATNANGTPEMTANSDYPLAIGSTYIHEALKRLTDYQKRHQLSARSIDRVLAQYGAVPTNLKLERSIYLGHQVNVIKSGAVMATANGETADGVSSNVGDYSGAGFGQSSDSIEFTCDDECVVICIASIIPQGNMVQGYDRTNRALTRFDFYQPELDFGVAAIEKGEVYVSPYQPFNSPVDGSDPVYTGVFGFTGQYGWRKRPRSFLTGDLSMTRLIQGADSWHLFRKFDDDSFGGHAANIVHSLSFTRGTDGNEYNRIFQYTNHDYDPFMCFMHFDVAAYAPCKPLFDTYDFESHGQSVNISNGNKVN